LGRTEGIAVPTEALLRAARCLERADECMRLAQEAADPALQTKYVEMAENYLAFARAEQQLAVELERLNPAAKGH